jgi:hypothetical protein
MRHPGSFRSGAALTQGLERRKSLIDFARRLVRDKEAAVLPEEPRAGVKKIEGEESIEREAKRR